ncbi:IQ domain-containing protein [Lineolata rhizophorae]|uniref:IQ domain-containing protein n=1 Tax=Lineolata rhizophorae TaxID=578093 RepID=A0A6A6P3G2_9PEZI|nr:IQ domain-containing protein [Lineolata rhizophorae]
MSARQTLRPLPQAPAGLPATDLQSLKKSTTGHFRTLSKYAENGEGDDFLIKSPAQEVAGLHGRRRLQRSAQAAGHTAASQWGGSRWMDQQRQFLQAYEYLCHIGEAKEWIEDVIHKSIPPIVQLEEALRDGVTLAEIVQALYPETPLRIFRHPKLQFRHSDNIALFFRLLEEAELPELFRFELVDLYEKKNIPKVIYCIHALSWLLYRKGILDFRIGNLVGQLEFEHHELEAMQKGLDKAGVSMPNFSSMGANFGAEPEPEPVETEEERIDRELGENADVILDFQCQLRGALTRIRLGDMMLELWDAEAALMDLQSRLRGDWSREIAEYRWEMHASAILLQSAIRGFLARTRRRGEEEYWQRKAPEVVVLQSLVRGRKARQQVQHIKSRVQRHGHGIRELQAAIRGALRRQEVTDQYYDARDRADEVEKLQAAVRGLLARQSMRTDKVGLKQEASTITTLQAALRGMMARKRAEQTLEDLDNSEPNWVAIQSEVRGALTRNNFNQLLEDLRSQSEKVEQMQAIVRGALKRLGVEATLNDIAEQEDTITDFQSFVRGHLLRNKRQADQRALQDALPATESLQAFARGFMVRQRAEEFLSSLEEHEEAATSLQGLMRAMFTRIKIGTTLAELEECEDTITEFQAQIRSMVVCSKFAEKKKYYKENMEKVVKIQSFVRGRQQGEAYKSLTSGKNPPVGTIKNFVHLLNDSDFDFDEEIESERLRKTVVQHVRQNEMAEQYIDQLDIKIALLVKNKITLDEVVKHQKHFGGHVGNLLSSKEISSKDPFDLKALNKNSRRKLEHYQELFFVLQTQPQYLARLFKRIREQGKPEKELKRFELLFMGLFGFAQKRREEYYLLKLISRSMKEEIEACPSLQDYVRGSYFWGKLLSSYIRSPRDRKFLRDLLGPLIKENIIENEGLDLESDPMQIYRSLLNNEELRTGQRSRKMPDIPREKAIQDPETRETFVRHLEDLRDISDLFFAAVEDLLHKMPYGIRFVAQQMLDHLRAKFPFEDQQHLLQVVGQWVWKTYLQPPLTQPETWGVVDRGLSPIHKRNLGEVAKVLGQVASGRLFGGERGENVYLVPLNTYITESIRRIEDIWAIMIDIREAEEQFDIDEFNDLYARTKPTLYIKLSDIFAIHQIVATDISCLCPAQDDVLREIIRELGSAKTNESEMMGVSSTEISLTLNPKFHDMEDPEAAVKSLFMETKRCVLYIIRIQSGPNLLSILVQPISTDDEARWEQLVEEEVAMQNPTGKKRSPYTDASTTPLVDITALSYSELKRICLENVLQLEAHHKISRHNHYQDILNDIAVDIRTKHRRRVQRARELEGVRATLAHLDEKAAWLDQQLKSYNDYIEQAMVTLQNKKGKKRFLLPFTKQYNHERELQKAGRVPRFGSYKYSARTLAEKGVLVSWAGYSERQWDKINLTISSDAVGIFHIEGSMGSMMIPGASASVPLDDLLQAQFNNCQFMNLFAQGSGDGPGRGGGGEGALRLNVNLFLHLVFKKFYRDE